MLRRIFAAVFVTALICLSLTAVSQGTPMVADTSPSPAVSPTPAPSSSPARRAKPPMLDSVFPLQEFLGPTIGVPRDTTAYPLMKLLGLDGDKVLGGLRVYGWINGGYTASTSKNSTYPQTYAIAPQGALDQAVINIEKQLDTVQTDHFDWGFALTGFYGIDYRWTTAKGWLSDQLLKYNRLYGFDPVIVNFQLYFPKIAEGLVLTIGRFISPADIEAQLAPQNLLYTHSVFFDFDAYTQTGVKAEVKLNDTWSLLLAVHTGNDTAPWDAGGHLSGEAMARWVSDDNKDGVWFGVNALNGGQFTSYKDNLQQFNVNWFHKFNDNINNQFEVYYLYSFNALVGGTVNFGPVKPFGPFGGGPGAPLPGRSTACGYVNYTNFKLDDKSFLTFRNDFLADPSGWRSGFPNAYFETTLGYTRHLTDTLTVRPEIRWETAFDNPAYANGTKKSQFNFNIDVIQYY